MNAPPSEVVFLLDVDNTLLDNDAVAADLQHHLVGAFGTEDAKDYWDIFEECRRRLGYADYLGALQQFRLVHPHSPRLLGISLFLLDYPFSNRLFPRALEVIAALAHRGPVVILSDGDVVFQPRKVERSGLWTAVEGRVLIYIHKEQMLEDVARRYPARRYVMVDDKVWILAAMKRIWQDRLKTVFVKQGHYVLDPRVPETVPPPDVVVESIGSLLDRAQTL